MRVIILLSLYMILAKPAYAYIDAGMGSLILQSLIAGFFTFMVMWRAWIDKVKNFFRKSSSPDISENSEK